MPHWLEPFALFMARKEAEGQGISWTEWPAAIHAPPNSPPASTPTGGCSSSSSASTKPLKRYCHERNIRLMGDVPIYVAHDSADVWQHPEEFQLDAHGRPTVVAGVPPDYFSATGQLWGNPIYRLGARWNEKASPGGSNGCALPSLPST